MNTNIDTGVKDHIKVKNARIHNLQGIDVNIPKNKLTVITGVSGSGKSSLAFDTLYEEGKRRYLMFSGTEFMVDAVQTFDSITGLSPTVAVEQRIIRQSNPRSTATYTGIFDRVRNLFAESDKARELGYPSGMFSVNSMGGCHKCKGDGVIHYHVGFGNFIDIDCDACGGSKGGNIIAAGTPGELKDNPCSVIGRYLK